MPFPFTESHSIGIDLRVQTIGKLIQKVGQIRIAKTFEDMEVRKATLGVKVKAKGAIEQGWVLGTRNCYVVNGTNYKLLSQIYIYSIG